MARSKDQKPRKASSTKRIDGHQPKNAPFFSWLRKPFVWIGTLVLAALAAAVSGWLQDRITDLLPVPPDSGDPVLITYTLLPGPLGDMSLPSGRQLSGVDLQRLSAMKPTDQVAWLEDQGAVRTGPRKLTMDVTGNRDHLVRLTDIRTASICNELDRGRGLVKTNWGTGVSIESKVLYLDVGDPLKPAEHFVLEDKEPKKKPYFPEKTLTLTGPEHEFLVLELQPDMNHLCHVRFELTVIDGDKQVRLLVPSGGEGFPVMPNVVNEPYPAVYLGGQICRNVVQAPADYRVHLAKYDMERACGPGNAGPLWKR